jgi:opacity protein-like surface antigen
MGIALGVILTSRNRLEAQETTGLWAVRMQAGGTIPQETSVTEFGRYRDYGNLKLDPGFRMDFSGGRRFLPWLEIGPELGFTFNGVDAIGGFSYPNSSLSQITFMANVRVEYPYQYRLVPFVGAGVGGVASFLTFGGGHGDHYYYDEPDGTGDDFSLVFQAFAGLRYRLTDRTSLGVEYRYLMTDRQHFSVDWWYGGGFDVAVDSVQMHSFSLVLTAEFW